MAVPSVRRSETTVHALLHRALVPDRAGAGRHACGEKAKALTFSSPLCGEGDRVAVEGLCDSGTKSPLRLVGCAAEPPPHCMGRRGDLYAVTISSACCRSTLTSWLMPRSGMVTPYRRSIRLMVTGLWVMTMKRVSV